MHIYVNILSLIADLSQLCSGWRCRIFLDQSIISPFQYQLQYAERFRSPYHSAPSRGQRQPKNVRIHSVHTSIGQRWAQDIGAFLASTFLLLEIIGAVSVSETFLTKFCKKRCRRCDEKWIRELLVIWGRIGNVNHHRTIAEYKSDGAGPSRNERAPRRREHTAVVNIFLKQIIKVIVWKWY